MRVAYIVSRFPSTTETFIAREMQALTDLGLDISLYALVRQSDAVIQPEAQPFLDRLHAARLRSARVVAAQAYWLARNPAAYLRTWRDAIVGNLRSPRFLLRALAVVPTAAWFARVMQAERVDRVHAHWATHSALAAWAVHRLTGLPYSITAHAHDIYVDRTMLGTKLREADFVAVISDYNRRLLTDEYGPDVAAKLHIVRCGVDVAAFAPVSAGSSPDAEERRPRVVCVASLQEYKGHRVLLDAVAVLAARGFDLDVRLIGDGALRAQLQARAAVLGIADRVDFMGARTSTQVAQVLQNSEVMVLASIVTASGKMEGIPVALMEALASGVPVVSTAISGIPELVRDGETGLVVPPGDAVALAAAIERLCREREFAVKLGIQGRAWVSEEFDLAVNAKRIYGAFVR